MFEGVCATVKVCFWSVNLVQSCFHSPSSEAESGNKSSIGRRDDKVIILRRVLRVGGCGWLDQQYMPDQCRRGRRATAG